MYCIIRYKSVDIPFSGSERIYLDVEIFKCPCLTTDSTEKFNQIIGLIHCFFSNPSVINLSSSPRAVCIDFVTLDGTLPDEVIGTSPVLAISTS